MINEFYIGTYTRPQGSRGIYGIRFDTESGRFGAPELLCETRDPSYIALGGAGRFMYAVDEQEERGGVNSFEKRGGRWIHTGYADSCGGAPCHVALKPDENALAVANYTDGAVALCELKDGALTGKTQAFEGHGGSGCHMNQPCAHAHQCNFIDDRLYVNDLGADTVRTFAECGGAWREEQPLLTLPGGAGPRHLVAGNDGSLYVLGELDSRLHVYLKRNGAYIHAADIPLTAADRHAALAPKADNSGAGAIKLSPDGRRIICSIRQHNSVCVLDIGADGIPLFVNEFDCGGKNPRDIAFAGEYVLCACQSGGGLVSLKLNADGSARRVDAADIAMPVCVIDSGTRG